ncbi:MAG: hypothetical protein K9K30_10590 [Burkholderiaceae bacterium]|nr:hypothetical protein [Sulfuritalea sp.]MCF8175674.1 hypothetical protein [Burkholderiaceae bacterium]
MDDETQQKEQEQALVTPPGKLAVVALRLIDVALRALQAARNRVEAPVADADERRPDRRSKDEEAEVAAIPVAGKKTLLHRALIVLMCLLFGAAAGSLVSYRLFSKQIDANEKIVEYMQLEIDEVRVDEARNREFRDKQQMQVGEYRKRLRATELEVEDYKRQIVELTRQSKASNYDQRPAGQRARAATKTGDCAMDSANLNDKLLGCIESFNRP